MLAAGTASLKDGVLVRGGREEGLGRVLEGSWLAPATPGADLDVFKAPWVIKGRTSDKNIPTPVHVSRENSNLKRCPTPLFTAVLFIMPRQKQPECLSTDERTKKTGHIYTMKYYSAIERNEIVLLAATWMDIETVMLSEVNQTEVNII